MNIPRRARGTEILADLGGQLVARSQHNKWIMSQGPVRTKLDSWFWRGVSAKTRSMHKVTDETQDGQWISKIKQNSSYQRFAKGSRASGKKCLKCSLPKPVQCYKLGVVFLTKHVLVIQWCQLRGEVGQDLAILAGM